MWLRALVRKRRVESEMEREMRFHLELETENNIRLGLPTAEARRRAFVAFGGVERAKEDVRDERRTRWLEQLAADIRFALRGFLRRPLFAGGVITLIALGVGANTAIFSLVDHLLIAPLPYPDGNRMAQFLGTAGGGQVLVTPTRSSIDLWRRRTRAVEQIVTYQAGTAELGDPTRGVTEYIQAANITPGVLAFTRTVPLFGRDVQPADTVQNAAPVALISYGLWQRSFSGSRDVLGRIVVVNGTSNVVVGVLPRNYSLPFVDDPTEVYPALRATGGDGPAEAMAKLRPGVTIDDANRELGQIFTDLDRDKSQDSPRLMRAVDELSITSRHVLYLMFGAVMLVLLIACANVANLMLSRAWSRQREFAIRAAMGAGRARLVRLVFTESLMLALTGGAAGLAVAAATTKFLIASQAGNQLDFTGSRLDSLTLLWATGVCLVTGVLFGLAPAVFVAGNRAADSLKAGTRAATASMGARRFRGALVIVEVALSAVLLVSAGLLGRTIFAMQRANLGFDPRGLSGIGLVAIDQHLADPASRSAVLAGALRRVRAVPGIRDATLATGLPPQFGTAMGALEIEGRQTAGTDSLSSVGFNSGASDYFTVTGTRIVQGRAFAPDQSLSDRLLGTELVVNEGFARRFWPEGGAIGARLRRGSGPWLTIVGVAADVQLPTSKRAWTKTQFYESMPAAPKQATLIVRSALPLAAILPQIQAAVHEASPFIKVRRTVVADDLIAGSRATHRFMLALLGIFAGLALVLAAFGLHAVIAYAVGQRTREIGVRVALGAQNAEVLRLVVGSGLRLSAVGIVVGAAGGLAAARAMRAMLYGVGAADPVTLGAVAVVLMLVGAAASYIPARRAMRVDVVEALRAD
jgi:predicted permease